MAMNRLLAVVALLAAGRPVYPPRMDGARVETYTSAGDARLPLYIFSPATASNAPAIIFHGRADTTVPFATAEAFAAKMKAAGNRCELAGFGGQPRGFFNKEPFRDQALKAADAFLVPLGWRKP
jgi:acetyl esterase/lipase